MGRLTPRVWVTVAGAPGAGVITLGAAVAGPYRSFAAAGVADGETVSYGLVDGSAWECGQGVYSASAGTLTRTVEASSNGNSAIAASSAATVYIAPTARDWAPKPLTDGPLDDQAFAASGTWTKPAVAGTWALVELWGAGQGGGKGATNANRYGGVGGQWRAYMLPFALLPASASITIGAGGAGATGASATGAAGGNTSAFGLTSFGGGYVVNTVTAYEASVGTYAVYGRALGSSVCGVMFAPPAVAAVDPSLQSNAYDAPSDFLAAPLAANMPTISGGLLAAAEFGSGLSAPGTTSVVTSATAPTYAGGRGAGATSGNVKINCTASTYGGAGGDNATTTNNTAGVAGSAPGGGGSAGTGTGSGGAGAAGRVRVRIY
jgi:hypothetical protein